MVIKSTFQLALARYEITVDEKDPIDALHQSITLSNPPRYCPLCKNNQFFHFDARKVNSKKDGKTYTYISVICNKCRAQATLGSHLTGGYFWKGFELYEGSDKTDDVPPPNEE